MALVVPLFRSLEEDAELDAVVDVEFQRGGIGVEVGFGMKGGDGGEMILVAPGAEEPVGSDGGGASRLAHEPNIQGLRRGCNDPRGAICYG